MSITLDLPLFLVLVNPPSPISPSFITMIGRRLNLLVIVIAVFARRPPLLKYSSDSVVNMIRPSFLKDSRTLIVSSYEYPAFLIWRA